MYSSSQRDQCGHSGLGPKGSVFESCLLVRWSLGPRGMGLLPGGLFLVSGKHAGLHTSAVTTSLSQSPWA